LLAARSDFRIFTDCDVPYELTTIGRILHLGGKEYHFVAGGWFDAQCGTIR